jgi:hypothetical protein
MQAEEFDNRKLCNLYFSQDTVRRMRLEVHL